MQILIDTDPFIYAIAWAAQPNCYWVDGMDFSTKREALAYCKEEEVDPKKIEKESFLFSPKYVRQFAKAQLRNVTKDCVEALFVEMPDEPIFNKVAWYMSSKRNGRKVIDTEYKGTRPPPPRWRDFVKNEIAISKDPVIVPGLEADDVLAFEQWKAWKEERLSCIVSIDKDLNNIPGWHYNPDKKVAYYTDLYGSFQTFMGQFLTGDSSDNIPGLKGIGPKKALALLPEFEDHFGLYPTIFSRFKVSTVALYAEQFDEPEERFDKNFSLLDVGGVWAEILDVEHRLKDLERLVEK